MICAKRDCDCPERLEQEKEYANTLLDIYKKTVLAQQTMITNSFLNKQSEGTIIQGGMKRYNTRDDE